jgi:sugar phosphate permease
MPRTHPNNYRKKHTAVLTADNTTPAAAAAVALPCMCMTPLVAGNCAKNFGWRWGMWAPGLIGCAVGLVVLGAVRDKPTDLGFPPTDASAQQKPAAAASPAVSPAAAAAGPTAAATGKQQQQPAAAASKASSSAGGSMWEALKSVMQQPAVWALAFTYFFIYVVRQGVTSWLVFYLMAEKGAADAGSAALTVSGLELGGLAGSTVAGLLSDRAIRGAKQGAGLVGKRIQVGCCCRRRTSSGSMLWHLERLLLRCWERGGRVCRMLGLLLPHVGELLFTHAERKG